jgi:hypothetical protein
MLPRRLCPECYGPLPAGEDDGHDCEREREVAHELARLRDGIVHLERDIRAYLDSAVGRFELWYARRARSR